VICGTATVAESGSAPSAETATRSAKFVRVAKLAPIAEALAKGYGSRKPKFIELRNRASAY
jgi:hypothetical protein